MASASSLRPYGGTDAVLAMLDPTVGTFTGEVSDGVLELATPVHGRVAEAIAVLQTVPYADNTTTREVQNMTIHRHGRFDRGAATGAAA